MLECPRGELIERENSLFVAAVLAQQFRYVLVSLIHRQVQRRTAQRRIGE